MWANPHQAILKYHNRKIIIPSLCVLWTPVDFTSVAPCAPRKNRPWNCSYSARHPSEIAGARGLHSARELHLVPQQVADEI